MQNNGIFITKLLRKETERLNANHVDFFFYETVLEGKVIIVTGKKCNNQIRKIQSLGYEKLQKEVLDTLGYAEKKKKKYMFFAIDIRKLENLNKE